MNDLYQKTIKSILLGLISVFIVVAFIGCGDDGSLGDEYNLPKAPSSTNKTSNTDNTNNASNKTDNKTSNETDNHCLPGQTPGKNC